MSRHASGRILVVALCVILLAAARVSAQETEADRERTERVADILTALGAREGARCGPAAR